MNRNIPFLLLCLLAAGCVTVSQQPWIENGRQVGTVKRVKTDYGAQLRYVDNAGLLKRTEMRSPTDEPLPGASVRMFDYDSGRRLIEERVLDGRGAPAACDFGYACKRLSYATDGRNNEVEEHAFFDTNGRVACTAGKYARARFLRQGPGGFIKEVLLEDAQNRPAAAVWDDVRGVYRSTYTTLTGIGDVRCGVYYDAKGSLIARKVLEGSCVAKNQGAAGPGPHAPPPIAPAPRFHPPPMRR
jgi:hypothetical protein